MNDDASTILLVEDDDLVRDLVQDVLVASGYRVLEARDGPSALARADEHGGRRGPWLRMLDRLGLGFDS
jgi:CheY-like chemotaxis protein